MKNDLYFFHDLGRCNPVLVVIPGARNRLCEKDQCSSKLTKHLVDNVQGGNGLSFKDKDKVFGEYMDETLEVADSMGDLLNKGRPTSSALVLVKSFIEHR